MGELRKARPHDFPALLQMLELYQYELSDIWPQEADLEAKYGYDLKRHKQGERFHAHVAIEGTQFVDFALQVTDGWWQGIVQQFNVPGADA